MAIIFCLEESVNGEKRKLSEVDYSLVDGRIREFILKGETLFSVDEGIAKEGWQDELVAFVRRTGLNKARDGRGIIHAFVRKMQEAGILPEGLDE